ncbi:hypothetical protein F4808DRAFT_446906 [Astrocystis sublimbata]|nr:hypothetical protein F4808DRAFT_447138 [Astrocystis sublimbata]KAI0187278.1 hypothetical protein F4808DRAFT_446906 [Astrocystis sublimbata]
MASKPCSDDFLSFRTSCDRCRFQKLKCSTVSSPEAPKEAACCQRCARAMVPCVFSRRNRSRRTITNSDTDAKRIRTRSVTSLDPSEYSEAAPIAHGVSMDVNMLSFNGDWSQVPLQNTVVANGMIGIEETLGYTFQGGSSLDHMQLHTNVVNIGAQGTPEEFDLSSYGMPSVSPDADAEEENDSPNPPTAFEANATFSERGNFVSMLLSLASDLHTRLETLENRPQQQSENSRGLDGYPIGSVLHLLQKFTNLLGDGHMAAATNRTSTALILISCYVTITQICTLVLSHFQSYLRSQPSRRVRRSPIGGEPGPQVCLGELPTTNPPHSQVYTAVCMLLDSLRQVDQALGLARDIRLAEDSGRWDDGGAPKTASVRNVSAQQQSPGLLAGYWQALTSLDSIQEPFTLLAEQVRDIKDQLREKMGL